MAREPRNETVRKERRHRVEDTLNRTYRDKLALPPEFRDDPDHQYRWANDEGSRIYDLTVSGEYDVVTSSVPEADGIHATTRPVNKEGLKAVLVREPKWIFDEDQAAKVKRTEAMMDQNLEQPTVDPQSQGTAYVAGTQTVKHGPYKSRSG